MISKLSSMGSPCIGNIGRYEKATADISMRGEFHPAISPGGGLLLAGTVVNTIARNTARRASCTYHIVRFGHEIITRSRFVPPGDVESGSYNRICYSPERRRVPKKTHFREIYACPCCMHVHALEVCAVGIRKRACTVTDRTWPEPDWPCSPPHKQTSRLYDAVNSPPLPLGSYFLRRPDWPWKATQDAATKLVQGGGLRAAVSGKHSFDTPPHGRPAFDTPPRGRH